MRKSKLVFIAFIWLSIFCISSAHALSVKVTEQKPLSDTLGAQEIFSVKSYLTNEKQAIVEMGFGFPTTDFVVRKSEIVKKGLQIELHLTVELRGNYTQALTPKRFLVEIQSEDSLINQRFSIFLHAGGSEAMVTFYDFISFIPSESVESRYIRGNLSIPSIYTFQFSSKRIEVKSEDALFSAGGDITLPIHLKEKIYMRKHFYKILYMKLEGGGDFGMPYDARWRELSEELHPDKECNAHQDEILPVQVYYSQYMDSLKVAPYNNVTASAPFKLAVEYFLDEKCKENPLVSEIFFFIRRD